MFTKFWEKIGEGVADKWMATVASPAFIFWGIGFLAYIQKFGTQDILAFIAKSSPVEQIVMLFVILTIIIFSAYIIEWIQGDVQVFLEGYWPKPLLWLRVLFTRYWAWKIKTKQEKIQKLRSSGKSELLPDLNRLEIEVENLPKLEKNAMPTLLGNIVRSYQEYSELRYGLEVNVCWSRLYFLISHEERDEYNASRERINEGIRVLIWGALSLAWLVWQPWALLSIILVWFAYKRTVLVAIIHGEVVKTCFDLNRLQLYENLHWDCPRNPDDEISQGKLMSEYLFRGNAPANFQYTLKQKKK